MKIFVCEFITGGGLYREPLLPSLAVEGALMRNALLHDLAGLEDIEVLTTYDARLPVPQCATECISVQPADDVWQVWDQCIQQADAVWLVAPETDEVLSRLTIMAEARHKPVLGCSSEAVKLTSSKVSTCQILQVAGVNTIRCYRLADWVPDDSHAWVAKPDDGVGCGDSRYFKSPGTLLEWIGQGRAATHIIQPWYPGISASISMLCKQGRCWLLSCNRQKVGLQEIDAEVSEFVYSGSVINDMAGHWEAFEEIARQVAKAIPGLAGYVGIDVVVNGEDIHVLEINPRLTTSYAGLHQAMGCNPARMVIDLLYNEGCRDHNRNKSFQFPPEILRRIVEINVNA